MSGPVTYRLDDSVAFITMDDGKVNVLGPTMQQALNDALDNADRDDAGAVVIAGNHRVFSGGFDLKILTSGEIAPAIDMLKGGFELSHRLLSYPKPVVMACTGHAIAMGAFLLASGDHRVAAHAFNIQANEVAIGMTIPYSALAVMKLRLDTVGLPASHRAGEDVLRRNRGRRRLARRNRVARHGAQPCRGGRAGIRHAQTARPCSGRSFGPGPMR